MIKSLLVTLILNYVFFLRHTKDESVIQNGTIVEKKDQ